MLFEEHTVDWMGSNEFEAGRALRGKARARYVGKGRGVSRLCTGMQGCSTRPPNKRMTAIYFGQFY